MKVLRIHTLQKGWCDRDHLLLHAAFQILVDFVEKEKPDKIVDWNCNPEQRHAWKEIRALHKWWTETRPARKSPLDEKGLKKPPLRWKKVPGPNCEELVQWDRTKYLDYDRALTEHARLERKWHKEDQRNLHRLVEIRPYLWV